MPAGHPAQQEAVYEEIKAVPQDAEVRARIRSAAAEVAAHLPRETVPRRERLTRLARRVLMSLGLPRRFEGFTMVAISNGFWREQFEAVPPDRRLLLLPKCLRDPDRCRGKFDSIGLHCAGCGACIIHELISQAEALGYETIVAEGTSSVIMKVLEGEADAILGVACLDSLDESFEPVADLGVPNQAIPLLRDGCERTETEPGLILELMTAHRGGSSRATRSAVPLLRETRSIFEPERLKVILGSHASQEALHGDGAAAGPMVETERLGIEWLRCGGKRLRPFVTVAAAALGRHGTAALDPRVDVSRFVSDPVRSLAVAIEALHKASLIHDDIADDDEYRYGRRTLHRTHGVGVAVNVGDWLVGVGYGLIVSQRGSLGGDCVADVLDRLAAAQLDLCRGQGAELSWLRAETDGLRPADALSIGALKTAPAFDAALYAGLRASGADFDAALIRRFSTYLGEAYQVLNDLEDWRSDDSNKIALGRDVLAGRPTILRAFALQASGRDALARAAETRDPERAVTAVRALYAELGVLDKARALVDRLRERCLALADEAAPEAIGELLRFLARAVLRERTEPRTSGA